MSTGRMQDNKPDCAQQPILLHCMGSMLTLLSCAGRMQDNEPLMRALSGLIVLNSPDLVLFVGEALVGNDAVDQLTKFAQRLADLSSGVRSECFATIFPSSSGSDVSARRFPVTAQGFCRQ